MLQFSRDGEKVWLFDCRVGYVSASGSQVVSGARNHPRNHQSSSTLVARQLSPRFLGRDVRWDHNIALCQAEIRLLRYEKNTGRRHNPPRVRRFKVAKKLADDCPPHVVGDRPLFVDCLPKQHKVGTCCRDALPPTPTGSRGFRGRLGLLP